MSVGLYPDTIEVKGESYPIVTDWLICYEVMCVLGSSVEDTVRVEALLTGMSVDSKPLPKCFETIVALMDFFNYPKVRDKESTYKELCAKYGEKLAKLELADMEAEEEENQEKSVKYYDLEKDREMIIRAVQKSLGICLNDSNIHWRYFVDTFMELGTLECEFNTIVGLRLRKEKNKMTAEDTAFYAENRYKVDL